MIGTSFSFPWSARRRLAQRVHSLPWKLRARFYEDAIHQMPQGDSPFEIFRDLQQSLLRRKKRTDAQRVHRAMRTIEDGESLVRALGADVGTVERSILEIGEQKNSGGLAAAMQQILDERARVTRIQSAAWGAVFEPLVCVGAMQSFFYVLGTEVMPAIESLVPRTHWNTLTHLLDWFGWLGTGAGPIVTAVGAIAAGVAATRALPVWTGRGRQWVERHLFVFRYYRELQGTTWLLGFVAQVKAGVPQANALAQQIRHASPWLASRLRPVYRSLIEGERLGDALRKSKLDFPSPDLIERIGRLDGGEGGVERMELLATEHAAKLEKRLRTLVTILGYASLGLMLSVMGLVQIASNGLTENMMNSAGM